MRRHIWAFVELAFGTAFSLDTLEHVEYPDFPHGVVGIAAKGRDRPTEELRPAARAGRRG